MKSDRAATPAHETLGDDIERAHLKEPGDASHTMRRYGVPADLSTLLRRFWIPVWSVPPGRDAPQRVLQHPVCLLVVTGEYARFYGVTSGLSTTTLTGRGWAVGVMCAPAAGYLLSGRSVAGYTDRFVDMAEVLDDAQVLVNRARAAMAPDPLSVRGHRLAMAAYADALRPFLPVDIEGALVNRLVAFVESHSDVTRVAQICDAFSLSERALQRIVRRRLGLTPKWLIQRRRLHEAVEHLRDQSTTLTQVAAALGYADQAHFIRDFSRVTAMTPGEFATLHRR